MLLALRFMLGSASSNLPVHPEGGGTEFDRWMGATFDRYRLERWTPRPAGHSDWSNPNV